MDAQFPFWGETGLAGLLSTTGDFSYIIFENISIYVYSYCDINLKSYL